MTDHYPITRYLSAHAAYVPRFTGNGDQLAFLYNVTGVPQVWRVDLPGPDGAPRWPQPLSFDTERVMDVRSSPVPGDPRLIYARDVGGNERAQLFLLDPASGSVTPLTAGHDDAMHGAGDWSRDGTRIAFSANRRDKGLFDLYVQSLDGDADARLVWHNDRPGFLFNIRFAPDAARVLVGWMPGSFQTELFEIDLASGDARQVTQSDEPVRYFSPAYSADGASIIVCTDRGADKMYIARLDLATGAWETLIESRWEVDGLVCSRDGRWLAYALNVDGASELYVYDLETRETRPVPLPATGPGMVMSGSGMIDASFSPDGDRLVYSYWSATTPANIYLWDMAARAAQPVTRVARGGLPDAAFVEPELITYPTFDEESPGQPRQIPAWYYRPAGASAANPAPVIVLVHGGPEGQFRPNFMRNYLYYYVQRGYAVLAPNVRGSIGYGKHYAHLDDVEKRMDSVADLAHAAYWLRQQPEIDGERIVVYGGSYGGFMVLAALTHYPDLWVAGVDIVGISSLVTFLENTSDYRRAHREAEYGSLARDRDFLDRIAPINHVDQIRVPLMVIHGANDPRVPLSEAEQLVTQLRARDVPVEFLVFDDEGHGIVKLTNKLTLYPQIAAFLEQYVEHHAGGGRD